MWRSSVQWKCSNLHLNRYISVRSLTLDWMGHAIWTCPHNKKRSGKEHFPFKVYTWPWIDSVWLRHKPGGSFGFLETGIWPNLEEFGRQLEWSLHVLRANRTLPIFHVTVLRVICTRWQCGKYWKDADWLGESPRPVVLKWSETHKFPLSISRKLNWWCNNPMNAFYFTNQWHFWEVVVAYFKLSIHYTIWTIL